jgi:hypothetical protein
MLTFTYLIRYHLTKSSLDGVALGYWKGGVSVYTNSPHYIASFKSSFPKIKTGIASINFKVTDAIHEDALERVIKSAMENRTEP